MQKETPFFAPDDPFTPSHPRLLPPLAFSSLLPTPCSLLGSLPAWTLGFPAWVSSLTHPERAPLPAPYIHSSWGFSFSAIRRRENADKVDSRCHGNHSPNYCVQPGSGLWEGGWERDGGRGGIEGGAKNRPPTFPQALLPSLPVLVSSGPHTLSPPCPTPYPLAPALQPQVQRPASPAS